MSLMISVMQYAILEALLSAKAEAMESEYKLYVAETTEMNDLSLLHGGDTQGSVKF